MTDPTPTLKERVEAKMEEAAYAVEEPSCEPANKCWDECREGYRTDVKEAETTAILELIEGEKEKSRKDMILGHVLYQDGEKAERQRIREAVEGMYQLCDCKEDCLHLLQGKYRVWNNALADVLKAIDA